MTMKYSKTVTLDRQQVNAILLNQGMEQHATILWREMQKAVAKKPAKLDFGQFSSAARDAEHRITLNDLVSALEHELHAAEVPECGPPPFDA